MTDNIMSLPEYRKEVRRLAREWETLCDEMLEAGAVLTIQDAEKEWLHSYGDIELMGATIGKFRGEDDGT
jgi:hypothetical protein